MSKLLNSKYLVITNTDGQPTAERITLKEAKKLLNNECLNRFIFKVPTTMYHNFMFKYPLSEYYSCLEINKYVDDVWISLNVMNKQEKNFTEYIEIVYEEPCYNIKHKTI